MTGVVSPLPRPSRSVRRGARYPDGGNRGRADRETPGMAVIPGLPEFSGTASDRACSAASRLGGPKHAFVPLRRVRGAASFQELVIDYVY
jgi:hypothetical protein